MKRLVLAAALLAYSANGNSITTLKEFNEYITKTYGNSYYNLVKIAHDNEYVTPKEFLGKNEPILNLNSDLELTLDKQIPKPKYFDHTSMTQIAKYLVQNTTNLDNLVNTQFIYMEDNVFDSNYNRYISMRASNHALYFGKLISQVRSNGQFINQIIVRRTLHNCCLA